MTDSPPYNLQVQYYNSKNKLLFFCTKMLVAIVTFRGRCGIPAKSKTKLPVILANGFHLLSIAAGARVIS